jgi:hypothetical protein
VKINYGVGELVQLTYQIAFLAVDEDAGPRGTLSDSLFERGASCVAFSCIPCSA